MRICTRRPHITICWWNVRHICIYTLIYSYTIIQKRCYITVQIIELKHRNMSLICQTLIFPVAVWSQRVIHCFEFPRLVEWHQAQLDIHHIIIFRKNSSHQSKPCDLFATSDHHESLHRDVLTIATNAYSLYVKQWWIQEFSFVPGPSPL